MRCPTHHMDSNHMASHPVDTRHKPSNQTTAHHLGHYHMATHDKGSSQTPHPSHGQQSDGQPSCRHPSQTQQSDDHPSPWRPIKWPPNTRPEVTHAKVNGDLQADAMYLSIHASGRAWCGRNIRDVPSSLGTARNETSSPESPTQRAFGRGLGSNALFRGQTLRGKELSQNWAAV